MANRFRNFCYTINNYTNVELEELKKKELKEIKYIIIGDEVSESGTPHLQGFIIYNNAKTLSGCIKNLPSRAHVEVCKGSPYQNFEYCSKHKVIYEKGNRPEKVGQGNRQDLRNIKKKIANNENIKSMLDSNDIQNYQQLKYAESLKKYYEKKRLYKPHVKWYYGKTGTGKTKTAYEEFSVQADNEDNIYFSMDTGKWWEGYDAQEYVIIDDMRGDFMKYHQLLKLLDRYPYKVETKGSTRQFLATNIIITSAFHPQDIFQSREDIGQLLRRIDEIKMFG